MNWKYYIPHGWHMRRYAWEDFYLLPCDPNYSGKSIWLTIDALGDGPSPLIGEKDFEQLNQKLEKRDYLIKGTNMIVRGTRFSKKEFLGWVRVWLEENGYEVENLVEAPFDDFAGTNQHAGIVSELEEMVEELESLDESELKERLVPRDMLDMTSDPDGNTEDS